MSTTAIIEIFSGIYKLCDNILIMQKKYAEFHLSPSRLKILETVSNLNAKSDFPSAEGIAKILGGAADRETIPYESSSTFGTLLSYRGRKLCSHITSLVRRGYLSYLFVEGDTGRYLKITELGRSASAADLKDHHRPHKRKAKKSKPTILHI